MTKVAFCFPGQGSLEAGMGREIAEAVPEAMEVYRIGSEASGLDLEELCFATPDRGARRDEVQQPALVTTSLAILAAMRARGLEPDVVVGHSVGEFAALAAVGCDRDGGRDRARARARSGDGRGRAAAPGRDGGDPRARGRGGREALPEGSSACGLRTTTARARSWSRARTRQLRSAAPRPRASAPDEQ